MNWPLVSVEPNGGLSTTEPADLARLQAALLAVKAVGVPRIWMPEWALRG